MWFQTSTIKISHFSLHCQCPSGIVTTGVQDLAKEIHCVLFVEFFKGFYMIFYILIAHFISWCIYFEYHCISKRTTQNYSSLLCKNNLFVPLFKNILSLTRYSDFSFCSFCISKFLFTSPPIMATPTVFLSPTRKEQTSKR